MTAIATQHPWEAAGLGLAPFTFVTLQENIAINPDYTQRANGCCDACGTGIRYECVILSANGKRFVVGTNCVAKLDRADNKFMAEVERAEAIRKSQARAEKKRAAWVAAQSTPEAVAKREAASAASYAAAQARADEMERNTEAFGEIAQIIAGNGGSFASDLAEQVRTNGLGSLTQRQFNFASDLYAKQFGRRNSKAYAAAYEAIIVRYEEVAV